MIYYLIVVNVWFNCLLFVELIVIIIETTKQQENTQKSKQANKSSKTMIHKLIITASIKHFYLKWSYLLLISLSKPTAEYLNIKYRLTNKILFK